MPSRRDVTCVSLSRHPGVDVVTVIGELDVCHEGSLRRLVSDNAQVTEPELILDLTGVTFLDARALGAIVYCRRVLAARSASLLLACPDGQALRVLKLMGFDRIVPIYPALEVALRDRATSHVRPSDPVGPKECRPRHHPRVGVRRRPSGRCAN